MPKDQISYILPWVTRDDRIRVHDNFVSTVRWYHDKFGRADFPDVSRVRVEVVYSRWWHRLKRAAWEPDSWGGGGVIKVWYQYGREDWKQESADLAHELAHVLVRQVCKATLPVCEDEFVAFTLENEYMNGLGLRGEYDLNSTKSEDHIYSFKLYQVLGHRQAYARVLSILGLESTAKK